MSLELPDVVHRLQQDLNTHGVSVLKDFKLFDASCPTAGYYALMYDPAYPGMCARATVVHVDAKKEKIFDVYYYDGYILYTAMKCAEKAYAVAFSCLSFFWCVH